MALDLPEPVREAVAAFARTEAARSPRARWVRPEGMHLTLAFLGEVAPARLPFLIATLAEVCARHPPFPLRVEGAGAFPPRGPSRALWLGCPAGAALAPFQRAVAEQAAAAVGLTPEARPFHPHLTLARTPEPWRRDAVERLVAAAAGRSFGEPFEVTEGVLMESELAPGGSRYRALERFALGGAA
ncbi:MAG TPA: RNA 2',3'-cyclic phosphodiesterase [Thermoanaerobaculia bacterium]|nr:RNA 2',3'-cyclic phosphodiesterase [Thermoanaerobaculia bacterium]